jgi:putative nucleotidyltransferase with HDIG domain
LQKAFSKNSVQDIELIEAFIAAVDARDHYTYDHSEHVSNYSEKLARKMNLSDEEVERVRLGALLHDIGKIGIPDNILNKIGNLTNEEYEVIKQHPIIGTKIIEPIKAMGVYGQIILYHHEWFDGTGYPYGLKESEIPLEARIVSICDVFDAMTTDRPYRSAIPKEKALQIINVMVGSQFDPEVWLHFNEMITNDIISKNGKTTDGIPS